MAKTCETVKLTKRSVDDAAPLIEGGKARQRLYFDTDLGGFGLCVGSKVKTYFAQGTVKGRFHRITIGRHGVFTVDEARKEAKKLLGDMARGSDPVEEKKLARAQGFTLREALDLAEATLKTKGRSEKTIEGYRYNVETYLSDWLPRPLADIGRDDAHRRHTRIAADVAAEKFSKGRPRTKEHGKATADGVMVSFRAIWNRARRAHPELQECPTVNVDLFRVKREKKELPLSQLHVWYKNVETMENPIRRDWCFFVLHTGLRRTSASEAKWEHVDFERAVLRVPNPKGGRAFDLPLTEYLVALLKQRQIDNSEAFNNSPWIFPAVSSSGHIAEPREEFDGVKWSPHDLRRWFITAAESLDVSAYVIKALVNHRLPSGDVTAGYVQHEVERLRPAMETIGAKLRALCEPPSGANVVPLKREPVAA